MAHRRIELATEKCHYVAEHLQLDAGLHAELRVVEAKRSNVEHRFGVALETIRKRPRGAEHGEEVLDVVGVEETLHACQLELMHAKGLAPRAQLRGAHFD